MLVFLKNPKLLPKYVALYAAHLIKENRIHNALDLYVKYGAPAIAQNYNIYKRICTSVMSMANTNKAESYRMWADLRDMLYDLVPTYIKVNTAVPV